MRVPGRARFLLLALLVAGGAGPGCALAASQAASSPPAPSLRELNPALVAARAARVEQLIGLARTIQGPVPLDCVIVGAGTAGTVAGMHAPECVLITLPGPAELSQGIHQGLGAALQDWSQIRYPQPPGLFRPRVAQPLDFRRGPGEQVTLAALEASRVSNELEHDLKVAEGRVSHLRVGRTRTLLTVELAGLRIRLAARLVVVAVGAGTTPNGLRAGQLAPGQAAVLRGLSGDEPVAPRVVPPLIADTHLLRLYRRATAEQLAGRWVVSGTGAGGASVALFLLRHGVDPGRITLLGRATDLEALALFREYHPVIEAARAGRLRTVAGTLGQIGLQGRQIRVTVASAGGPTDVVAEHLVTAFNMRSELDRLLLPEGQRAVPLVFAAPDPRGGGRGPLGRALGLQLVDAQGNRLPVLIVGAAATTFPLGLFGPGHDAAGPAFLRLLAAENALWPGVYTPAAIPFWAPKVALAVLAMRALHLPERSRDACSRQLRRQPAALGRFVDCLQAAGVDAARLHQQVGR